MSCSLVVAFGDRWSPLALPGLDRWKPTYAGSPARARAGEGRRSGTLAPVPQPPTGTDEDDEQTGAQQGADEQTEPDEQAGAQDRADDAPEPPPPWSRWSAPPPAASPTWPSTWPCGSAARWSTPTRCSSTAGWTSAPPSCPCAERRGVPTTSSTSSTCGRRPASRRTSGRPAPTSPRSGAAAACRCSSAARPLRPGRAGPAGDPADRPRGPGRAGGRARGAGSRCSASA